VISFVNQLRNDEVAVGGRVLRFFSSSTVESHILVLAVAVLLAGRGARGAGFALAHLDARGGVRARAPRRAARGITVTGLVFAFVLVPDQDGIGVGSVLLGDVSPPLVLLAGSCSGRVRARSIRAIGLALAWPPAWLAWTLVHGAITGWYPYGFIDVDEHVIGVVLRNALCVLLLGFVLLAVFVAVDRSRARVASRA
jgi:hypothetical protein